MIAPLLSLALALAPLADCKKCGDTGLVPCPDEPRHACTGSAALSCSIAAACPHCGGTHRVPCAKCERAPGAEYAAEQERHRAFLVEVKPIDDVLGRPLAHARSAHFLLTYDLRKVDAPGGGTLHGGMHLYLERLEQHFARFCIDLGALEQDFLAPTHVLLWEKQADQEKAALVFARQSSSTEAKLMGKEPVVTIFHDKEWLHEEYELHQAVVHQVTHCLLSNVWDGIWPGNIRGGWIDEGLAHAYELRLFDVVRHYCYVETDTILEVKKGTWEPDVRAAVERGEAPGFLGVAGKNTTELTPEDNYFAWSYVDFLLRAHPDRFGPLARAVKARKPIQSALAETMQLSPFEFEERWRAFVLANYELRRKRR